MTLGRDAMGDMDVCQHSASLLHPVMACPLCAQLPSEGQRGGKKKYSAPGPLPLELGPMIGWLAPATTSSVSLIWEGVLGLSFFFFSPSDSPGMLRTGAPADLPRLLLARPLYVRWR